MVLQTSQKRKNYKQANLANSLRVWASWTVGTVYFTSKAVCLSFQSRPIFKDAMCSIQSKQQQMDTPLPEKES